MFLSMSQVVLVYFAWVYELSCSQTSDRSVDAPYEITGYWLNGGNNTFRM